MAFEALRASLSDQNIVEETFSKFTWIHDEVRNMEIDTLCKLWKAKNGEAVMKRVQDRMSSASAEDLRRSMELVSLLLPKLIQSEGSATIVAKAEPLRSSIFDIQSSA